MVIDMEHTLYSSKQSYSYINKHIAILLEEDIFFCFTYHKFPNINMIKESNNVDHLKWKYVSRFILDEWCEWIL